MAPDSDAELVARCRDGDEDAWQELVDRFARYVHAIVTRGFGLRDHDAEDVFQDVFARMYERLPSLRADDAVRPWLAQLTRRTCLDRMRSDRHETPVDEVADVAGDDVFDRLDEALAVHHALEHLSPECREILDRFFARDESYRTIGEALDLPSGTVASRISRCLVRLRGELEGRNTPAAASGEQVNG